MIQAPTSQGSETRMSQALGVQTTRVLGIMLIASGLLMCIFQTACTIITIEEELPSAHLAGGGIWCGVIILISGILGVLTAKHKTYALVSIF